MRLNRDFPDSTSNWRKNGSRNSAEDMGAFVKATDAIQERQRSKVGLKVRTNGTVEETLDHLERAVIS